MSSADIDEELTIEEVNGDVECECNSDDEPITPFGDMLNNVTIEVDGKCIYKATVLGNLLSTTKLFEDRLRRIYGLSACPAGVNSDDDNYDNLVFIRDPLIVSCDNNTTMANIC